MRRLQAATVSCLDFTPLFGSFGATSVCGGRKPANSLVRDNNFGFALGVRRFAFVDKRFAPVSELELAARMRPGIQCTQFHATGRQPPVKWNLGDETSAIAGRWAAPEEEARWTI